MLASHPAVGEVGVTRMPHPQHYGAEVLLAAIVLRAGQRTTPAELVVFQAGQLAPYEVVRRFTFSDRAAQDCGWQDIAQIVASGRAAEYCDGRGGLLR